MTTMLMILALAPAFASDSHSSDSHASPPPAPAPAPASSRSRETAAPHLSTPASSKTTAKAAEATAKTTAKPAPKPAKPAATQPKAEPKAEAKAEAKPAAGHSEVHWTYDASDTGPAHWGELSPAFAACKDGHAQTPIDVNTRYAYEVGLDNVVLHYHPTPGAKVSDNGHTVVVSMPTGDAVEVDGQYFELLQFHFHAPSEHRLDGQPFPMEMHLVHKDAKGQLAVLGVFIQPGAENAALSAVFDAMGVKPGEAQTLSSPIDPAALLPTNTEVARYAGSLTTPPCSEGVRWVVFTHPIEASAEQIAAFTALYDNNARPIQGMNGRSLLLDATP